MTRLLRRIFFLKRIYVRHTWADLVYGAFFGILVLFFAFGLLTLASDWASAWLSAAIAIIVVYAVLRAGVRDWLIQGRLSSNWPQADPKVTRGLSIDQENSSARFRRLNDIQHGPDWHLYDLLFEVYRHTRSGDYLAKQVCYTVYETKLKRQLPHVVFDSKVAKGGQFRYQYISSQRVELEGDFSKYFDAYMPQTYKIDVLSFIAPDAMQAILLAKNYDIEILDDRLLLYGPLLAKSDLPALRQAGQTVADAINNNIGHYKDDRLLGRARNSSVTPFGRSLLISPFKNICIAICFTIALMTFFYITHLRDLSGSDSRSGAANIFGALFLGWLVSLYKAGSIVLYNRRALQRAKLADSYVAQQNQAVRFKRYASGSKDN